MGVIEDVVRALAGKTSQKAVSVQLGVTESTISQFLSGKRGLGLEPLLLLSVVSGRSPADILTAAGKNDALNILQQSFGPAAKVRSVQLPSEAAMEVAGAFDQLEPKHKAIIVGMLEAFGHPAKQARGKGAGRLHMKASNA